MYKEFEDTTGMQDFLSGYVDEFIKAVEDKIVDIIEEVMCRSIYKDDGSYDMDMIKWFFDNFEIIREESDIVYGDGYLRTSIELYPQRKYYK